MSDGRKLFSNDSVLTGFGNELYSLGITVAFIS